MAKAETVPNPHAGFHLRQPSADPKRIIEHGKQQILGAKLAVMNVFVIGSLGCIK